MVAEGGRGAGPAGLFSERMTPHKPQILVTRRLPASIEARMATLFETDVNEADVALTSEDILSGLAGKDVLVSTITDRIDADLVERLPRSVRLIAPFGKGVDNIDLEAAWARGLTGTHTPDGMNGAT